MGFEEIKIEVMPGGVTNKNYKLIVGNKKYAIRIPGVGTENYIDRKKEFDNISKVSEIGIAPKIYFYDADTGFQVSEFIDGKVLTDKDIRQNSNLRKAVANIMRQYHKSDIIFESEFNPVSATHANLNLLAENEYDDYFPGWQKMNMVFQEISEHLKKQKIKLCPCHNDTLAGNFIGDENGLRMIDWEYSGMNDPFYDLACFSMENKLDALMEEELLKEYSSDSMTDEMYVRFYENKFLTAFYWSVWSCLQIAYGKDRKFYYNYGMERYRYLPQCIHKIQEYTT